MLSLFATICCFLPTGIIAIVKSSEVSQSFVPNIMCNNTLKDDIFCNNTFTIVLQREWALNEL